MRRAGERLTVENATSLMWLCALLFFGLGVGHLAAGAAEDAGMFCFWLCAAVLGFAVMTYRYEADFDLRAGTLTLRRRTCLVPFWKAVHGLDRARGVEFDEEYMKEHTEYHIGVVLEDPGDGAPSTVTVRVFTSRSALRAAEFARELARFLGLREPPPAGGGEKWVLGGLIESLVDGPREFVAHVRRLRGGGDASRAATGEGAGFAARKWSIEDGDYRAWGDGDRAFVEVRLPRPPERPFSMELPERAPDMDATQASLVGALLARGAERVDVGRSDPLVARARFLQTQRVQDEAPQAARELRGLAGLRREAPDARAVSPSPSHGARRGRAIGEGAARCSLVEGAAEIEGELDLADDGGGVAVVFFASPPGSDDARAHLRIAFAEVSRVSLSGLVRRTLTIETRSGAAHTFRGDVARIHDLVSFEMRNRGDVSDARGER